MPGWRPTHVLAVRPGGEAPDLLVEVMLLPHHHEDGAMPAYSQAEWDAQAPPGWGLARSGRWMRRHRGTLVPFIGTVVATPAPPAGPAGSVLRPRRLLIVDDEPRLGAALARAVRTLSTSWMPSVAEGAEQALQLWAGLRFDAVVSDRRMPGMDGRLLLRELERRQPDSVRILLTGSGSVAECAAAHRVLRKPCPAAALLRTIEALAAA